MKKHVKIKPVTFNELMNENTPISIKKTTVTTCQNSVKTSLCDDVHDFVHFDEDNVSLEEIQQMDIQLYEITKKIRNGEQLTTSDYNYIFTLNDKQKMEIIMLYEYCLQRFIQNWIS